MGKKILKRSLVMGILLVLSAYNSVGATEISLKLPAGSMLAPVSHQNLVDAGLLPILTTIYYAGGQGKSVENVKIKVANEFYRNDYDMYLWAGFTQHAEGTVSNCAVEVTNNMTFDIDYAEIAGCNLANATNQRAYANFVSINGATLKFKKDLLLFGALANPKAKQSKLEGNYLEIVNSKFYCDDGGSLILYGASNNGADAIGNEVKINNLEIYGYDGTDLIKNHQNINTEICGGSGENLADSNVVKIKNSDITGATVYGGFSKNGDAINNEVYLKDVIVQNTKLYGGVAGNGQVSGNILNIGANITGKLNTIGGFSAINFENIDWKHGKNIIETENLELVNTDIIVKNITGDPKVNDYMNLIVSDNQIVGSLANQGEQTVKVSAAQVVKTTTGTLEQEPNIIKFTIIGSELNPQVGALADANVVANAFVANGTGLVEDSINAMMCEERIGYKTFAQLHGSNLDFDTNNNLSVQGWSGIVGVGETTRDRLTYGVFFETGDGDYNTFAKQSEGYVRGDGEVNYNGGGLLVRKDYENGIYTEASLRAGRMNNEVRDAVVDSSNKLNGFDISSTYYGAHIGVGKIIPRGEKESLDIYGKFLYSHHDGDSFVIDGDTFNMDSVNSQRLRVGFRYNELNSSKLRMYYGAAYEYEFDGDANNTVLDYNFSSPDMGGSTVVGELGVHYNADAKWCFDLNVRGYAGQREGFTGSVQANYLF